MIFLNCVYQHTLQLGLLLFNLVNEPDVAMFLFGNHRYRKTETTLQPLFLILVYLFGLLVYQESKNEQHRMKSKYGRIVPFFDTSFDPSPNACLPNETQVDIPDQVTLSNAYILSFSCATKPYPGGGLKHTSTPFLGLPRGHLPLLILANLLAGDISLNPGPTTSMSSEYAAMPTGVSSNVSMVSQVSSTPRNAATTTRYQRRRGRKAKYPCGLCEYAVKSTGIQCTNCTAWFHIKCSDISSNELKFHSEHPDAIWLCRTCNNKLCKLIL